jgi:hypothetical protein
MKTLSQLINWNFKVNGSLEIKDKDGNQVYYEYPNRVWERREYDSQGNLIYQETSNGIWWKREYDPQGNEMIYYENSQGYISDNRPKTCENKEVEIDGVKYKLTKICPIQEETGENSSEFMNEEEKEEHQYQEALNNSRFNEIETRLEELKWYFYNYSMQYVRESEYIEIQKKKQKIEKKKEYSALVNQGRNEVEKLKNKIVKERLETLKSKVNSWEGYENWMWNQMDVF